MWVSLGYLWLPMSIVVSCIIMQLADFLFVRRNWLRDQRRIQNTFSNIKRLQTPVWITSFVEGTRFSPIKLREVGLFQASKDKMLIIQQQ